MTLKTAYLPESTITEMARAALSSYEMACSWRKAGQAAAECAADDFGVKASQAQIAYAVRLAQAKWEGIKMEIRGCAA